MARRYSSFFLLALTMALVAGPASAQSETATFTPSKDNTMYENSGSRSNGAGDYLFVGSANTFGSRRALLAFDVTALPGSAQVDSVRLQIHVSMTAPDAGPMPVNVHRVTRAWGEGGSDAGAPGGNGTTAESGDATWTHAFFDTQAWATPGGDYSSPASGTIQIQATSPGTYGADSDGLAADVQAWIEDSESNFGWILVGDEAAPQTARRLDGGSHGTEANRPRLTVYYSVSTARDDADLPGSFALEGNHPNPFRTATSIRYELDQGAEVLLRVYDVTGRPVATLVEQVQAAGPHEVAMPAGGLASGLYVYCLSAGSERQCLTTMIVR